MGDILNVQIFAVRHRWKRVFEVLPIVKHDAATKVPTVPATTYLCEQSLSLRLHALHFHAIVWTRHEPAKFIFELNDIGYKEVPLKMVR